MKIGDKRKCDVCGSIIPPRTQYRVAVIDRDGLSAFMNASADTQPTWIEVGDGTGRLRLDICITCNVAMGGSDPTQRSPATPSS